MSTPLPPLISTERQALIAMANLLRGVAYGGSSLDFADALAVAAGGAVARDEGISYPVGSLQLITLTKDGALKVDAEGQMLMLLTLLTQQIQGLREDIQQLTEAVT